MKAITSATLVSATSLKVVGITLAVIGSLFTVARYVIRGVKRRFWQWEDTFVLLAWCCFMVLVILYLYIIPPMYRILAFEADEKPYPMLAADAGRLVDIFFPNTMLLWCCLWLVKFSFLSQSKRLIERQRNYLIAWWISLFLTCIFFVGCIASEFESCTSLHAWFTFGQCETPRDARAALISLYYAYAVDILTDIMILALPLKVLWRLQITLGKKLRVLSFFFVVAIGISAATVRVIAIGESSGSDQPSPSWLALWAIVETGIAVIVASLPSFGLLFPTKISTSKGYDYDGNYGSTKSDNAHRGFGISINHTFSPGLTSGRHETTIEGGAASFDHLHDNKTGVTMTTTVDVREIKAHTSEMGSIRTPSTDMSEKRVETDHQ